jgi:hypothetical protein
LVSAAAFSSLSFALNLPASAYSLAIFIFSSAAFWAAMAFCSFSFASCSLNSLATFLSSSSLF